MHIRGSRALSTDTEQRLAGLSKDIAATSNLEQALAKALDAAIALLHADLGNIQLYRAGVLTIAAHRGFQPKFLDYFRRVDAEQDCACGRAMREGRPMIIADVMLDWQFAPFRAVAAEAGYRAVQSTPLVTTSGLFVGMLSTHFRSPHTPADEEMALLSHYAAPVADTIQKFVTERLIALV